MNYMKEGNNMYGIYIDGLLVRKFEKPEEAYEAGVYGYKETGIFHEIRIVNPLSKTIFE